MESKVFRFKQFCVKNEKSAMKVNTDGVLLGACVRISQLAETQSGEPRGKFKVLDAGTGTGTIALMLAQRLSELTKEFTIKGIDIDRSSAEEAEENFANSPWPDNLSAEHKALSECRDKFDLIVSNPPYFDEALKNPDTRKQTARHTADQDGEGVAMSYRTLLDFADTQLSDNGSIAMILPADKESQALRYAGAYGFKALSIRRIQSTERKVPSRIVVQWSKKNESDSSKESPSTCAISNLVIQCDGKYTDDYILLMKDFYFLF